MIVTDYAPLSRLIDEISHDYVRKIVSQIEAEVLKELGIEESPDNVIVMASVPDENIVSFIRKEDWGPLKTMDKTIYEEAREKVIKRVKFDGLDFPTIAEFRKEEDDDGRE